MGKGHHSQPLLNQTPSDALHAKPAWGSPPPQRHHISYWNEITSDTTFYAISENLISFLNAISV